MGEMLGKLILDAITYFVRDTTEEVIDWFLKLIVVVQSYSMDVLNLEVVKNAVTASQMLAATILVLKVSYESFMIYILRMDGEATDPGGLLLRTAKAVAVIGCIPWIVLWIFQFGHALSFDVATLPGMDLVKGTEKLSEVFTMIIQAGQYILIVCPIIVIAAIILLLVVIQTFVRAGELAMIAVAGSYMALGLTNSDSQMFDSWWRELLSAALSQTVQLFMIKVSFFALTVPSNMSPTGPILIVHVIMFASTLWVAYKSPSVMKQYISSTGVGRAAGGATKSVVTTMLQKAVFRG